MTTEPDTTAAEPTAGERRIGRPPKVDEHGTPTPERLLDAAVAACIERGYEEATLSDIARRADVSTPAVYSHFAGKAELMIARYLGHGPEYTEVKTAETVEW